MKWFFWTFGAASLLCAGTQYVVFGMAPWQTLVAIALSSVLALVGTRVLGETDFNLVGPIGKVTQLVFALLAPGNVPSNLMAAGVASAGANSCGDMMQDLETGRLLGASPRTQFLAQLLGIVTGSLVTVLVFIEASEILTPGRSRGRIRGDFGWAPRCACPGSSDPFGLVRASTGPHDSSARAVGGHRDGGLRALLRRAGRGGVLPGVGGGLVPAG